MPNTGDTPCPRPFGKLRAGAGALPLCTPIRCMKATFEARPLARKGVRHRTRFGRPLSASESNEPKTHLNPRSASVCATTCPNDKLAWVHRREVPKVVLLTLSRTCGRSCAGLMAAPFGTRLN